MRMCFVSRFFFYTLRVFYKKKVRKNDACLFQTMNIPCKGWQKNWSASGVGTTVFHLQNGSHVAVPNGDFPRGGQRQGKCEFPTSLSEVQECSSSFFGGFVGFI